MSQKNKLRRQISGNFWAIYHNLAASRKCGIFAKTVQRTLAKCLETADSDGYSRLLYYVIRYNV